MSETNVKELIERKDIYCVKIQYCKNAELLSYVLYDLNYSDKYGNGYVQAYCGPYSNKLFTFKIDRIKDIKPIWTRITFNDVVSASGIYVFACAGDNHILFEIYRLEKGERLWKYFEGEFEHCNGWFVVTPEAFHYLPEYDPNCSEWESCSLSEMDSAHLKVIACSTNKNIEYLLIEGNSVIGYYGKTSIEDISESNFLLESTFPIF
ncbi:hypothetical protein [Bacteroides acidifaciens]|jgi:hypothetical protein|uniref:hypothetical protein n=3 Tax=Bacteroides acidifaciens TaxID=85831 RepID=UPI001F59EC30|nr:hypothetical protein [Bacteroides acidifaciens]